MFENSLCISFLQHLMDLASETSLNRGHDMVWLTLPDALKLSITTNNAKCKNCDAWVQVDTKPAPNGILIGGPAVALDCYER